MSELSSPFIHNVWIFASFNLKNTKAEFYNAMVILFTFPLCRSVKTDSLTTTTGFFNDFSEFLRIVPIIPLCRFFVHLISRMAWQDRTTGDQLLVVYFMIIAVCLDCMNIFWFTKIVRSAIRKIKNLDKKKN